MRAAILAVVPACFGGGPAPTPAADATVVLALPVPSGNGGSQCNGNTPYLGSVAIGDGLGFAMTLPYEGPDCNGDVGMIPLANVPVMTFPLDGSNPAGTISTSDAGAQSNATTRPRIAADGDTELWAISSNGANVVVGGGATQNLNEFPAVDTAALLADTDAVYLGLWLTQNGHADPNGPPWPGDSQNVFSLAPNLTGMPVYHLTKIARSDGSKTDLGTPALFCEVMKDCLVHNADSLFAMSRDTGSHLAAISQIDKATGTSTDLDTIESDLAGNVGPVGLAADGTHVVWTAAVDPQLGTGCFVFVHTLGGATSMVLSSTSFSCADAAIDDEHVYFAIVSVDDSHAWHGDGIGRVAFADNTFESVRMHFADPASGPRRVYVSGDSLYAVDPTVIARIPTDALAGHQDF